MSSRTDADLQQKDDFSASTKPVGVRFPNRNYNDDWTRTLDAFDILDTLGEGTFGWVQKARDRQNGDIVALKKIKMENETEGFPITAIREIKILKTLRDRLNTQNVVLLKEVVAAPERDMNSDDKGSIYLVFEYLEHDLAGLMDLRWDTMFRTETIKCFMKQLLEGLHALHHNKLLHRDIKASNLLVNNEGVLKIADFGLARPQVDEPHAYTANVITLWYRPPELLFAENKRHSAVYSSYVDIWSAGCILAEMIFHAPLFKGKTELELLESIFKVLGTPTKETHPELWPPPKYEPVKPGARGAAGGPSMRAKDGSTPDGAGEVPEMRLVPSPYEGWAKFRPATIYPPRLRDMCEQHRVPAKTFEFLSALLSYDPVKRLRAADALDHDWFWEDPLPCKPAEIGTGNCPPSNEMLSRKQKDEDRIRQQAKQHQRGGSSRPPHAPHGHPPPGSAPHHHASQSASHRGMHHSGSASHGTAHHASQGSHHAHSSHPSHRPAHPHSTHSSQPHHPTHPQSAPRPHGTNSTSTPTSHLPPGHRSLSAKPSSSTHGGIPFPNTSHSTASSSTHMGQNRSMPPSSRPLPPGASLGLGPKAPHPHGASHPMPPGAKPPPPMKPPPPSSTPPPLVASHSSPQPASSTSSSAPSSSAYAASTSYVSSQPHNLPPNGHLSHPGYPRANPPHSGHASSSHAPHQASTNAKMVTQTVPQNSATHRPAPSSASHPAPHYPATDGFTHNVENPNKRFKTDGPTSSIAPDGGMNGTGPH